MNFIPVPRTMPSTEEYLSVLNEEQRAAVEHEGSPLLILAGAGSGKTRVITTKIAYLIGEKNIDPYSILAVTFTKKAAAEMAERAHRLHPAAKNAVIRTFHSFGSWFLRLYAEEAGLDSNFTVYDDDDAVTLLSKAIPSLTRPEASHFAHKIALAKDYCLEPDSEELAQIDSAENFPAIYQAYEDRLRRTGNIDFGDLIMLPVKLMQSNANIRAHMHRRFKVVMVDEFQDANVAQFKLLEQLVGENTYVCVVGDDDQSIYKFRGAEVQNILNFPNHFDGTTIIKLEKNYRSIEQVLDVANDVIKNNQDRFDKQLKPVRPKGEQPVLVFLDSNFDETEFCSQVIQNAHEQGVPYSDWAVLYRTNSQSLGFETDFLHKKIPYVIVGSLKFYDREEIKDALAFLALTVNPKDEVAFRRIINKPARGIGDKTQDKIVLKVLKKQPGLLNEDFTFLDACAQIAPELTKKAREGVQSFVTIMQSFIDMINQGQKDALPLPVEKLAQEINQETEQIAEPTEKQKLSYLVEQITLLSGLGEYHSSQDEISGTQRVANLQELANSAALYPLSRDGLLDFLDHIELDKSMETQGDSEGDAVTLITVHNTKGLEFPRVILTGMEAGVFPRTDKKEEELEEERRLFYVGITRSRDQLILTSCRRRTRYGRSEEMYPSPFLLEIQPNRMKMLGSIPLVFKNAEKSRKIESVSHPLAAKWKKGCRIFHDDYGYGYITSANVIEQDYVIFVRFESGAEKRFMPEYQQNSLMLAEN